jgi:ATP-binding cassette subfamily G (WHITE) protein 1
MGVQDRNGCLFFIAVAVSLNSILGTILIFPEERPVFLREAHNKMYTVSAYFFGKLLSELPSSLLSPAIHASCLYFSVGLNNNTPWKFPIHILIEMLLFFAGAAYTLIISVAFTDKKVAVSLIPILLAPFMLLSGFFVPPSYMPFWLEPFNKISFYRYGFQALMINEYTDLVIECMEIPPNKMGHCDPLKDAQFTETLEESMIYLCILIVGCMGVSLWIMKVLSHKAY